MEVDIIDTCREMVLNGLGYGILPEICLKGCTDLNTWELILKGETLYRKTWLVFNESSLNLSVSNAFIEFIRGSKA
jgi:DNA-binding transcriptional LysR family regulator